MEGTIIIITSLFYFRNTFHRPQSVSNRKLEQNLEPVYRIYSYPLIILTCYKLSFFTLSLEGNVSIDPGLSFKTFFATSGVLVNRLVNP